MSEMFIKVDEHTPLLLKALVKYSPHPQIFFEEIVYRGVLEL